ncbi:S-layer homology domain-containing protein [Paenibacillus forsythiae]|uniref:S-layer homology domain-containing protein n=1 Tax=Paenibacillus forsythiae TaxID=365616 RepID=UPI0009FE9007
MEKGTQKHKYTDANVISDFAKKAVEMTSSLGLIQGFSDRTFKPRSLTTRAETVVVMKRLLFTHFI